MIPNQWTQPTKLYNIIYVVVEKVTDVAFSFYRINTGCNIVIILTILPPWFSEVLKNKVFLKSPLLDVNM